jgi:hypothetical protein
MTGRKANGSYAQFEGGLVPRGILPGGDDAADNELPWPCAP